MTKEEIMAMKPGRELDKLVAEKVMSWNGFWTDGKTIMAYSPMEQAMGVGYGERSEIWEYSTSISAAWEVVEKLKEHYHFIFLKCVGETYQASFVPNEYYIEHGDHYIDDYFERYEGNTAPEAICKAALIEIMQSEKRLAVME